jgi:hypothetical protein
MLSGEERLQARELLLAKIDRVYKWRPEHSCESKEFDESTDIIVKYYMSQMKSFGDRWEFLSEKEKENLKDFAIMVLKMTIPPVN